MKLLKAFTDGAVKALDEKVQPAIDDKLATATSDITLVAGLADVAVDSLRQKLIKLGK